MAAGKFVESVSTESAEHIRPMHRHIAIRLVLEGGFLPEDVRPMPPLRSYAQGGNHYLAFDSAIEDSVESVVLGAVKGKRIDIVVSKKGVGPVVAISVKGTGKAFRNLVNRTEEAIGDCANIHAMHPGLVYGFIHFLKAICPGGTSVPPNDMSLDAKGDVLPAIQSYARILVGLSGRKSLRNDCATYEAVSLAMVRPGGPQEQPGLLTSFPTRDHPLFLDTFFQSIYRCYDFRYPYTYTDPALRHLARVEWHPDSPAIKALAQKRFRGLLDYLPRSS
jgi:hypothetical protein